MLRLLRILRLAIGALAIVGMPRVSGVDKTRLQRGRTLSSGATGGGYNDKEALGVPATITANGQTAWFDGSDISTILGILAVAGPVTGTTPTLDVVCETDDGAGGSIRSLGAFTQKTAITAAERKVFNGVDQRYRFRWTVGGTTPSFGGVTITGEAK